MNNRLKIWGIAVAVALLASGVAWAAWKKKNNVPAPPAADEKALLAQADAAMTQGATAEAKRLYQQVLQSNPAAPAAAAAQQRLGEANIKLLLSPAVAGGSDTRRLGAPALTPDASSYTVQPGDSLSKIARKSGTTVELLRISNGLRGDLIRTGQQLKVVRVKFSVIVDKSQNTLTLKNGEEVVKVYRCSTGAGGMTPTGEFKIVSRMVDPVWKGVIPPGSSENPLGSRWLGFDLPEYGIHGTNQPETIGKPVTKGCIRLINSDVEELYNLLPEGTVVTLVE